MRNIRFRRILAILLVLCLSLGYGSPLASAADPAEENNASALEAFLEKLVSLEQYAADYAAANPDCGSDAFELVLNYCRTAKEDYTSSNWSSLAGEENEGFRDYVAQQDEENGTSVGEIKTYSATGKDFIPVANGNKIDLFHIFGTMNISYYWGSRYPELSARPYADLGGWAGDLVDLLTKCTDLSGTEDEMIREVYWNRFANDLGPGSFDIDDVYGDFDAYYFMQTAGAGQGSLSQIMREYYTPELSMKDRAVFFTEHRFSGNLSREALRDAVKSAYSGNILLAALESNEGLENVDAQREACVYAFADYLYMLVNGPAFETDEAALNAGQTLEETPVSGSAASLYGDPVEGSFSWKQPQTVVEQSGYYTAVFTPADSFHFGETELSVPVIVDGQPIDEPDPDPDPDPEPNPDPEPEPDPVPDNSYFSIFYNNTSVLAPGVQQRILHTRTRDNKQMVIYAATIDVSRQDVALQANYNENDPTTIPTLSPVSDQMKAAQAKHTDPADPEHYVENYNVVFGSNADFFTMANGKPTSAFVMEGVVYSDAATSGSGSSNYFFAILKDGTPIISRNSTWNTYRDNCQEAVGGGALLVENGETKVSSSSNYYNSRAPRTCIGITADNKVVVMCIDGRQEPWSCGASSQEMAAAMISLGCVKAMNLDGGGSTTFVSKPEGEDELRVINRPSDGYERRVSTSLMVVSTAPNSNVLDHVSLQPENEYLMPGASVSVSEIGVNAAGGSAELPADLQIVLDKPDFGSFQDGCFTAGSETGDVVLSAISGDAVLGSVTLHVVIPDALAFDTNEVSAIYGQTVELPLVGYYNGNKIAMNFASDLLIYGLMNPNAGSITAAVLTAADESCGVRSTDIGAALAADNSIYARTTLYLYHENEAVFDFNHATAGSRKLAWNRVVSNSEMTRDENGTLDVYNLVEPGVPMEISYTFALDMNDLEIPDNIAEALPVVASFLGVDASELGAWQLLLALAERVSPLTTVTVKVFVDPRLDLDISDMQINCDYFELTDKEFDSESSTLTLKAHWIKVYGPIPAATANPLCIVSGLKAHVKPGAQWDANDRLTITNSGEITYEVGVRSSQAYSLASGALGKQYGLYPYDNTANLEGDKGAMFGGKHTEFSDSFILDSTDYEGWVTTEDGTVFYYVNNKKLTGLQKLPTPEGDKQLYYVFAENGVLLRKYTGKLELEDGLHYVVLGQEVTRWYELDDGIHYFDPATGVSVTGTQTIDGFTYLFEDYVLVRGEFRQLDTGAWRYRWAGQWYAKGWFVVEGKKYFAIRGGNLHTGIQNVEKFGESGNESVRFHLFDDHGVWQENANGLYLNLDGKTYLAENGFMVQYPGLVQIDGDYYYFTSKNYMVQGTDYWVSKTNGLMPSARYSFAEDGKMILHTEPDPEPTEPSEPTEPDPTEPDPTEPEPEVKNGIYAEDGSLYYYKNGARYYAGLIIIDGDYYYVRTGGEVVHGKRYTASKTNGLLPIKQYLFADDGKLILDETPPTPTEPTEPDPDVKNGIYAEDGSLYYYKNGARYYAGLIIIDGDYYYVRTGGEVVHGKRYTVSKNNGLLPIKQYLFADDGKLILP